MKVALIGQGSNGECIRQWLERRQVSIIGSADTVPDIYILLATGRELVEQAQRLPANDRPVFHTDGLQSKDLLQNASHYGILWPLQFGTGERSPTLVLDASSATALQLLHRLAAALGATTAVMGQEERRRMHLAAIVAIHFTDHLRALAQDFCASEGMDFELLRPAIGSAALNRAHRPAEYSRQFEGFGDPSIVNRHLALLEMHPYLKRLYLRFTNSSMGWAAPAR